MNLREKQSAFALALAQLIVWIYQQGWQVTLADVGVRPLRKVEHGGRTFRAIDREHMDGSLHYARLAADINLFVDGEYITDGEHPAWKAIGEQWKRSHVLARWGGEFGDANHVSFAHEGKA